MAGDEQSIVRSARRIFQLQLVGLALALLLGGVVGWDALHHRTQAALLLLVGGMLVLDGTTLPVNARLLSPDPKSRPTWVGWVSTLAVVLGTALVVSAVVSLWRSLRN